MKKSGVSVFPALLLFAVAVFATATPSWAGTLLSESFDDVSMLSGKGWVLVNEGSSPGETVEFYQGYQDAFMSQAGAPEAYAASNFNAAGVGGTLANWLITPVFSTAAAGKVTFWARGIADPGYEDHVAYGFSGGSSATAAFTSMTDPILLPGGWQEFNVAFAARGAGSTARFAIEYVGEADLSNFVGVDTLSINTEATSPAPEPSTWAIMVLGFAGVGFMVGRRSRKDQAVALPAA